MPGPLTLYKAFKECQPPPTLNKLQKIIACAYAKYR